MRMRLKEVKWTLWVKEELGACCRQRAQSERELGRQMCLLLTASTEHLMVRDGGPQPLSSIPLVPHFITFSRAPFSAFVNMSSHHSYFTVISIVSQFSRQCCVFFFFFPRNVFLFQFHLFRVCAQGLALMPRRLGRFFFFRYFGVGVMYSLWCDIQPERVNTG